MANSGYFPAPGQQAANKYPRTGANYAKYGEQPGWVYSPRDDRYYRDQASRDKLSQYEQDNGLAAKPPKQQGLADVILPVAGVGLALEAGKGLGQNALDYTRDLYKNGFGAKGSPSAPVPDAATTPSPVGTAPTTTTAPTVAGANQGMLGGNVPAASAPSGSGVQVISPGQVQPPGTVAIGTSADGGMIVAPESEIMPNGELSEGASADFGKISQGAMGGLQLYNAYQMYKGGDKVGAGLLGTAGAANVATTAGANLGTYAVPGLNAVAGLYGGYKTAQYLSDAPSGGQRNSSGALQGAGAGAGVGAAIGSVVPGIGTAIGGVVGGIVGGLAGLAGSLTGSSKGKQQMIRDKARESLVAGGILDKDYKGTLADGSQFDFGKDGKGLAHIDYEDPTSGRVIGLGNVIAAGEGMYGRGTDSLSSLYTGAALSNAGGDYNKAKQNMLHFAQQRGMNLDNLSAQYKKMLDAGQINQGQYDAYLNGARELFSGVPAQAPGQSGQALDKTPPPPGTTSAPSQGNLRSQTISPGIGKDGRPINRGLLR